MVNLMKPDVDTQNQEPKIKERINRVGIEGFKTNLKVLGRSGEFSHSPTIDVMINLGENRKGVHMSRLMESINEVVSRHSKGAVKSLERFGYEVLRKIEKKHPYERGELRISTILILKKITPVSRKQSTEHYNVTVKVIKDKETVRKYLEVTAQGATACPHSYSLTNGKAHVQRTTIKLGVLTDVDTTLPLETLIEIAESSFSAPTYSVVKSGDERFLVNKLYENPKFVEDLARECLNKVKALNIEGKVWIRAVSYESIHKHNAVSEIERRL